MCHRKSGAASKPSRNQRNKFSRPSRCFHVVPVRPAVSVHLPADFGKNEAKPPANVQTMILLTKKLSAKASEECGIVPQPATKRDLAVECFQRNARDSPFRAFFGQKMAKIVKISLFLRIRYRTLTLRVRVLPARSAWDQSNSFGIGPG